MRAVKHYGAKKDANHKIMVAALEKFGAAVIDLSGVGCGVPDLVVCCRGVWRMVDVKNPKTGYGRRGLNPRQKEWAAAWKGGPVYMIGTLEEAAKLVAGQIEDLKSFGNMEHPEAQKVALSIDTRSKKHKGRNWRAAPILRVYSPEDAVAKVSALCGDEAITEVQRCTTGRG